MSKIGVRIDGRTYIVEVDLFQPDRSKLQVLVDGQPLAVTIPGKDAYMENGDWIIVGDRPYEVVFDQDLRWIQSYYGLHRLELRDLGSPFAQSRFRNGRIKAPIPGLIKCVLVQPGDYVEIGQPLLVLEAMKMENEIRAPHSGTISSLKVNAGEDVSLHQVLVEIQ